MSRVLVAMSGGVDSSVAAALLVEAGHEVVGVTMRLWGGPSDTGCCSVSDVDDARRVAQQLGIDHVVFNFSAVFDAHVVEPYVQAHAEYRTPNPCIECNRHVKFDTLYDRADLLGFDVIATGHHARIGRRGGRYTLERAADGAKDQSYVVHMLDQARLARTSFPVGAMTKAEARAFATRLGLRTAAKRDSQDVCFIAAGDRAGFVSRRTPTTPATVVDGEGQAIGTVPSLQLVTIGQRRGLGLGGTASPRYVVDVDPAARTVTVGDATALLRTTCPLAGVSWVDDPVAGQVLVQSSAHGRVQRATIGEVGPDGTLVVEWHEPQRIVAPGQSVVFYDLDDRCVLGGGIAQRESTAPGRDGATTNAAR